MDRNSLEKLIKDNGGTTSATVSKKVTHLLCEEESTSKYNKAEAMGIPIHDEAWVHAQLKGKGGKQATKTPKAAAAAEKAEDLDPASMSLGELKTQLKARGLPVSGTKPVLVERLTAACGGGGDGKKKTTGKRKAPAAAKKSANKKKQASSEEDDNNDNDESDGDDGDDSDDRDDGAARGKKQKGETIFNPAWRFNMGKCDAFGLCLDHTKGQCWGGDEEGNVVQLDAESGELLQSYRLCAGVKCIASDGGWIYAGCNSGAIYDLTRGVPRLLCQVEDGADDEIYWMDIRHGQVAVSYCSGDLALVNCEGEVVWKKEGKTGSEGWMVRMDDEAIFHGHSQGVVRYNWAGKQQWHCKNAGIKDVKFGVQEGQFLYVAAKAGILKLDKKTGKILLEFKTSGYSSSNTSCKNMVISAVEYDQSFEVFDGSTGGLQHSVHTGLAVMSMQMAPDGTRLYGVADGSCVFCVAPATFANKKAATKCMVRALAKNNKPVMPEGAVEKASKAEVAAGVVLICVKENSKLRIRVDDNNSGSYNTSWNVQFPVKLRKEGARYLVSGVEASAGGAFYRVVGDIKTMG